VKKSFLLALFFICVQILGSKGFCQDLTTQFPDTETDTVIDAAHFTDTWPDEQLTALAMEPGQASTIGQFKKLVSHLNADTGESPVIFSYFFAAAFRKVADCSTSYLMLIYPFHNFW